ncbi:growth hormone-regulated TBC protein 1-like [Anneissia japonica]|uniref:growth hormone-regulated TBC protein 1-like n=1 Tax=Anneissia japonica TaxID=1529436 RepID=UPI0014254E98|nr:growth hormone-regulated TBC protein 1-like [Anneissia japonica]
MATSSEPDAETKLMFKSEIDAYGFKRAADFDYDSYEEFMSEYLTILARRASKWKKVFKSQKTLSKSRKVKRYVRKGIPGEHRADVWMVVSGASFHMSNNTGLYQRLLNGPKDPKLCETIQIDLHRTFPENIFYCNDAAESKRPSLQNVLTAYGHHNPAVGYCQGMNFITALMLVIVQDEEKCFFLLDALLGSLLEPGYYSEDLIGTKVEQGVLMELLKLKMPDVAAHIEKHDLELSLPTTKWFICLFLDVLPIETVLRIWDCMFYEGSKVIFRVALALIKRNMEEILRAQCFSSLIEAFKKSTLSSANLDCHEFMQIAFREPLTRATLNKLRQEVRERLKEEQR